MKKDTTLQLENLSVGKKAKLIRLSRELRQVDIASLARCQPADITDLEYDAWLPDRTRLRIYHALGMQQEIDTFLEYLAKLKRGEVTRDDRPV